MEYEVREDRFKRLAYIVLLVATILPGLLIYRSMTAQDDFDWTAGQIKYYPRQYAFVSLESGQTLVTDIVRDYEITLPSGWQTKGARILRFELIEDDPSASSLQEGGQAEQAEQGESICEIKTKTVDRGVIIDVSTILEERIAYYDKTEDNKFIRVSAGVVPAVRIEPSQKAEPARDRKKTSKARDKDFIYELQIPVDWNIIVYALYSDEENTVTCKREFDKIKNSFVYY